jgi:hypothetical protein
MSCGFDDLNIGGQLKVGQGFVPAIKEGNSKINGSAFVEGPMVVGAGVHFPTPYATMMVGPLANPDPDCLPPFAPGALCQGLSNPYSLVVSPNAGIMGNLDVNFRIQAGGMIVAGGPIMSNCGRHVLSVKKDFDIPHPTKEGYRLRHVAPEAATADVYTRGKVRNKNKIFLPPYWKNLVSPSSITVNLTPIGAHQQVIVKRISDNTVHLQSNGGIPINCYYHIYGERIDCDRNIAEYPGTSPKDYPGDNSEYLQSGSF